MVPARDSGMMVVLLLALICGYPTVLLSGTYFVDVFWGWRIERTQLCNVGYLFSMCKYTYSFFVWYAYLPTQLANSGYRPVYVSVGCGERVMALWWACNDCTRVPACSLYWSDDWSRHWFLTIPAPPLSTSPYRAVGICDYCLLSSLGSQSRT